MAQQTNPKKRAVRNPRDMSGRQVKTSVVLPIELIDRLEVIGERLDRNRSYLIREACRRYVAQMEESAK